MLALVEPRLAAVVTPRPSGLALAQAALPLIDLVSLPEPPTKRRLVAIPEDGVMGYEQQRIQHCMELVANRLADFSGHYVLQSQFSEALFVVAAFVYCFEELFGVDGAESLGAVCRLLRQEAGAMKKCLWMTASRTGKPFPLLVANV